MVSIESNGEIWSFVEKASLLCCLMFTQKSYSFFGSVHFLDTYNNSMIVCLWIEQIKVWNFNLFWLNMASKKRGRVAAKNAEKSERSMRQKATMQYLMSDSDSEDDGSKQNFDLQDKLTSTRFPQYLQYFIKELSGDQVNLAYLQR